MNFLGDLGHPELLPYIKTYKPGDFLFAQGDLSNSMVLILEGHICLFSEKQGRSQLVSMLQSGQVLGEKLILSQEKYPRALTAQAANVVTVLELTSEIIEELTQNSPEVLRRLLTNVVQVLSQRFENTNRLVKILRSSDNRRRLIELIGYLGDTLGAKREGGFEVLLTMDTLTYYLDMERKEILSLIGELVSSGALIKKSDVRFLIPDKKKLLLLAHGFEKAKQAV